MNERAKYKLIGFIMMFASSSLMGGIGAFTRFIDAPGDFVSFWRNFAGLIALSIIFLFIGGFKKVKTTRFSGTMLLSGIFLGLLSGLYCLSTQYTTLANASFLIYTGPIYSTVLAAIFLGGGAVESVCKLVLANIPGIPAALRDCLDGYLATDLATLAQGAVCDPMVYVQAGATILVAGAACVLVMRRRSLG